MSDLVKRIQTNLVSAMKDKDTMRLSVLRMLKAEIQKLQADHDRSYELKDEEVISVVKRLVKQRKDAAGQYSSGGALDRAEAELAEVSILEEFLPRQLSEEEIDRIISEISEKVDPSGPADTGRMMGHVMPKVKGMADGKIVRARVTSFLEGLER